MSESDQNIFAKAVAKLRAGESLTASEQRVVDAMKEKQLADSLRGVRPKFFNELFGIQNLQRQQWEETLGIPCGRGRETIDMFAVATEIRNIFSKRSELISESNDIAEKKKQKLEEEIVKLQHQNIKLRAENETLAGDRLPRKPVEERLERMAAVIRQVGDDLARRPRMTGEDAQRLLNHALQNYMRELNELKTEGTP